MAGAKETPRQKMIGLMYLVLLAMLALNVDSAVLERFIFLDRALDKQATTTSKKNTGLVHNIATAVEEKGNRAADKSVLQKAQGLRKETEQILDKLIGLKEEIIERTGGIDEETGEIVGAKDLDMTGTIMILEKKGKDLQETLNNFTKKVSNMMGVELEMIAKDAKDDPYFSKIGNQKMKDFAEVSFESTPTAAGMATLSQFMNQVLEYERDALEYLARQVGAKDIAFDKIVPMVLPESRVVAAGTKYKAQMFISASATGLVPKMKFNGTPIKVDANGMGYFEFSARTSPNDVFDNEGRIKKTFLAEIEINDTTFAERISYEVVKPVVQIQSASVQALYRNCGNKLNVNVPALGTEYNPTFQVTGGEAFSNPSKKQEVTIVPNTNLLTLKVYSDNFYIDEIEFQVKQIPKPFIRVMVGGREMDEKQGFDKLPRTISLDAQPDEDFQNFLPDDATFRVSKWECILARGTRAVETLTVRGPKANIASFVAKAKAGDRIVIDLKEVQRRNFRNKIEVVPMPSAAKIKQIPIN